MSQTEETYSLHRQVWEGTLTEVSSLPPETDLELRDPHGRTALMLAVMLGRTSLAKILVEAKADVKAEDENGKTAENLAEDIKEDEMAAFLKACATGKIPAKAPTAKVSRKYFDFLD